MRVLVVTNMYPREEDPSYGVFVAEQLRSLREAGVNADLYYIEGYRNRWTYVRAVRELRRRRGYDLYHAHHAYAAAAALLGHAKPLVVTVHEGAVIRNAVYRRFVKAVTRRASRRIAVSPALARALTPLTSTVIPIGVDLDLFRPRDRFACRYELGLAADKKFVLFAAHPWRPEKRFDLARAAVALVREEDPSVELITLPPASRGQVATYYGAANVVLVTSDYESGPLTVKEAVASERPVVSRRVGDVDFLAGCAACVVAGDTPAAIAAGIKRALAIGEVDRAAVQPFELASTARRLIGLYEEVISVARP